MVADLEGLGLKTKTQEQENLGTEEAGTVDSLDPTGSVDKGTTDHRHLLGRRGGHDARRHRDKPGKTDKPDKGNGKGNKG